MTLENTDALRQDIAHRLEEILQNARLAAPEQAEVIFLQGAITLSKMEHGHDSPWSEREPSAQRYVETLRQRHYSSGAARRESA